jgi:hypothetical protein
MEVEGKVHLVEISYLLTALENLELELHANRSRRICRENIRMSTKDSLRLM